MAMSNEQMLDQIAGLIAESRVEFRQAISDLELEIRTGFSGVRKNQIVQEAKLDSLEWEFDELKKVLKAQDQALDGLTQLGKTNFDMNESILKAIHGESGSVTIRHGATEESSGANPQ